VLPNLRAFVDRPDCRYLGDGVYVVTDDYSNVIIFSTDGIRVSNMIVLEPRPLVELLDWIRQRTIDDIDNS
jgi:hypothetical protein